MQGHRGPKPQEQRRPRIVWIPVASASARPAEGYDNEDYPCRGRSLCLPAGRLCPASSALTPDFSVSASASGHATRIASAVGRVALSTLSQHPWRTATLAWRFMCVCLVERAPHLSPSTPSSILPHHATQYAVEDETQVVALKRLSRHHGSNVMTIWRSSLWADPSGHLLAALAMEPGLPRLVVLVRPRPPISMSLRASIIGLPNVGKSNLFNAIVVRCFEDDDIVHVNGRVEPGSDIDVINLELIFSDL
ncbi:Ribosome-binding ATPase YchF [Zea mays]|uniref:Uncharacterized protein n=2 Tax=Zea mays TaxID=4577 RepID=B4FHC0_MAIZE|nr:unknown [Zea mays]AQK74811.1 hypothetical protein ZEAMMB73_Zm00001d018012 [Zea mays]ONM13918.1 hypothetical protein ZEAMMB73_Zm00001d002320 [Zea mays]PWZ13462.1 Ribosome-binding ATPase YchF [Zea mays]|eukprot:NP_001132598.1 uncharacterized protein LOC100194070 [Zea mays]